MLYFYGRTWLKHGTRHAELSYFSVVFTVFLSHALLAWRMRGPANQLSLMLIFMHRTQSSIAPSLVVSSSGL